MSAAMLKWRYRAWRYRYRLERGEIRLVLQHLSPGDVAVDVGAHKGAYAYWMRRAVGPGGRVYAFEPQPTLAAALGALVSEGGFSNIRVENLALSSSPGTMTLTVPGQGTSPGASLEPAEAGSDGRSYPVTVTTLDEYFSGPDRTRIRLLKCDAEGHELEVFRGGRRLLEEVRPVLLFECERRHRASGSVREVFAWLEQRGYEGYFVDARGAHAIEGFDELRQQVRSDAPGYVNNFLFLPLTRTAAEIASGAAA